MKNLEKYSIFLGKIEKWIAGVTIGASTAFVFIGVICRYVFNYGYSGLEELERYLIIWSVFVASSYAIKANSHITVSVFIDLLPGNMKRAVKSFAVLVGLAFTIFLFMQGVRITLDSFWAGEVSSSTMRIPMFLVRIVLPFGAILMIIRFIECMLLVWKRPKEAGID